MKKIGVEKKSVLQVLEKIELTEKEISDLKVLYDMLGADGSDDDWKDFETEFKKAKADIESLYEETLYSGEHDDAGALLVLHAGAGGEGCIRWPRIRAIRCRALHQAARIISTTARFWRSTGR